MFPSYKIYKVAAFYQKIMYQLRLKNEICVNFYDYF